MNLDLLMIGGILLILAFLIGVKKNTWLLSGFNEKRVSDKNKLSILVGGFNGIMSVLFLFAGMLSFQYHQVLLIILLSGNILLIAYVNARMVD